ncbi:MAG TPA: hypothetical protein VFJ43_13895 [Bacteroidia bacterium]|nr:hypothetical protein [Bacteroidia bacterium]
MKKNIPLILFIASMIFSSLVKSQSLGVSGSFVGFFPKYRPIDYYNSNTYITRTIGHTGNFSPGIRLEGNYILPGYSIPVSGFNGIGFTYFFPVIDSAVYTARLKNYGNLPVNILGTSRITYTQFSFRFAYEIPQSFNEFLLLNAGWGVGYMHYKKENILPEKTPAFNYEKSDFDESAFVPVKKGSAAIEILFGGTYEFEHFYIMAHYSLILDFGDDSENPVRYRHGLTAGIFYPLKRF